MKKEKIIPLLLLFAACAIYWRFLNPSVHSSCVTATTTIYATLIGILLPLLALAATIYIFIAGALQQRSNTYEQLTIKKTQEYAVKYLARLTGFSILSIIGCYLFDNNVPFEKILSDLSGDKAKYVIVLVSFMTCVFLMIYIYMSIDYEKALIRIAKQNRKQVYPDYPEKSSRNPFYLMKRLRRKYGQETFLGEFFKSVGDIEVLAERVIKNHQAELHNEDQFKILADIISKKKGSSSDFTENYRNLIQYRNYLLVEKEYTDLNEKEQEFLKRKITELELELRKGLLLGEQLEDLCFTAPFFERSSRHHWNWKLETTSFRQCAFSGLDFQGSCLRGCNFKEARLAEINLSHSDCSGADFSGSSWKQVRFTLDTNFSGATFREADFNFQRFPNGGRGNRAPVLLCNFRSTSFLKANLIGCKFNQIDFRFTDFGQALLQNACLSNICLSNAGFKNAVMAGCVIEYADSAPQGLFAGKEYWNESKFPLNSASHHMFSPSDRKNFCPASFMDLAGAVLVKASLKSLEATGSRIENCNFTSAKLENCILDRCYGKQASFQEAILIKCCFDHAMLRRIDLSFAKLIDCEFLHANLKDCLIAEAKIVGRNPDKPLSFRYADFTDSQLRGCEFVNCDFTGALFNNVNMIDVTFRHCSFHKAKFDDTYIAHTKWFFCDFDDNPIRKRVLCSKITFEDEDSKAAMPITETVKKGDWTDGSK